MITLKSRGKSVIDIEEPSIAKILNIYPDEHLLDRPVFRNALTSGELSFSDLRKECATLLIPWQLFLLSPERLAMEVAAIDEKRKSKFKRKLIASRDNEGGGVSLRIADRIIALQDYARDRVETDNIFCGSLTTLHRDKWPAFIVEYFEIDPSKLQSGKKEKTLDYLISLVEAKNIRVARGVMNSKNKLLPVENKIRATELVDQNHTTQ